MAAPRMIEHEGRTMSMRQWALALGMTEGQLHKRITTYGWAVERALTAPLNDSNRSHGMRGTPEYTVWRSMVQRCTSPTSLQWKNYGGRGIAVCPEWVADFAAFFAYVGSRPSPRHELDREDNNGNYEPGNVRWVTRRVNGRTNRVLELNGERLTLADWAERAGLHRDTLANRLRRFGGDLGKAMSAPLHPGAVTRRRAAADRRAA